MKLSCVVCSAENTARVMPKELGTSKEEILATCVGFACLQGLIVGAVIGQNVKRMTYCPRHAQRFKQIAEHLTKDPTWREIMATWAAKT